MDFMKVFDLYTSGYIKMDSTSNVIITIFGVALLQYLLIAVYFSIVTRLGGKNKNPPLIPYILPLFGSFPIGILWDPRQYVCSSKYAFSSPHPVRIKFMFQEFYILQGPKNITALFKQHSLSAFAVHGSLLRYVFLLPVSAAKTYYKDNSGENEVPREDSMVEPHNRVDLLTRSSFNKFLTGPGLAPLCARFEKNISQRLETLNIGHDWTPLSDLMDLHHSHTTGAVIDAMCGNFLLKQYPEFTRDLWTLDHNVTALFARTPKIFISKAHNARDRALSAIKTWHSWARQNFKPESVADDGDDPYWGTKFFRDRQPMFLNMDGFNADAVASQELAFLWGANTNAIITAFWLTLEIFKDPQLLQDIREEVQSCVTEDSIVGLRFDIPKLLSQPLLQAAFAETLRLRVNGFLVRRPVKNDLNIHEWTLSKDRFCFTSSTPGHMDPKVWCTGSNSNHPATKFWPGRFLKRNPKTQTHEFSLKGTEGAWMPFGGGVHTCPGKAFAKLINFLTVALMVSKYDCKVLADKGNMEMSTRNFGFGTLGPKGKIPVAMKRRSAK